MARPKEEENIMAVCDLHTEEIKRGKTERIDQKRENIKGIIKYTC